MLPVISTLLAVAISIVFLKPYLRTPERRRIFLRFGLILLPVATIGYLVVTYINYNSKPESFRNGVQLLQKNRDIQRRIGIFDSYTYFDKDLPKKTDNPALFKVSLKGSLATIYLTCKMSKDSTGKWKMVEFYQDSIKATTSK